MLQVSVQKIADHKWVIRDANGRGFADVIDLYKRADVKIKYEPEFWSTRRQAQARLTEIAEMAAKRTGGAYEMVGR